MNTSQARAMRSGLQPIPFGFSEKPKPGFVLVCGRIQSHVFPITIRLS
jgi:hypothetical protein